MRTEIKTTGDLRRQLAKAAMAVINGEMSIDTANVLHKISRNITDSLYSEAKIENLQKNLGREVAKFGEMEIG